jgi:DNA-binding MarR family transcriptional regulator
MSSPQESQLVLGLINLNSKVQRKIGGALSAHGLGVSEYLVLSQLFESANHTMRRVDLAEKVGLTASGVTRLLNPMEKVGLVEKVSSSRDARVSLVKLTSAGRRVFEEAEVTINHAAESLMAVLNAKQQKDFGKLIQAFG